MARPMMWKPLSERVQSVLDGKAARIKAQMDYIERDTAKTVLCIETNMLAAALLTEAGFDVKTDRWESGAYLEVQLGHFSATKAGRQAANDTILKARRALDSRKLEETNRYVDDTDKDNVRIVVALKAEEFPGLRLVYSLPPTRSKKTKCRIVRKYYNTLVCEKE